MGFWSKVKKALGITPKPPKEVKQPTAPKTRAVPREQDWEPWFPTDQEIQNVYGQVSDLFPAQTPKSVRPDFVTGWIEPGESYYSRKQAREHLFNTMRQWAVPIEHFPWAEWREWYEGT